ncbi:MAG: hypothetical protein CMO81_01150 [Waddliaceae bacterium]|nr:hypothetical protein [Waddliaceae bacterium]
MLLSLVVKLQNIISNYETSLQISNLSEVMQIKEASGIERAVLANVFASKTFAQALQDKWKGLVDRQQEAATQYMGNTSSIRRNSFQNFLKSDLQVTVEQYRSEANKLTTSEDTSVNSQSWFTASTKRIAYLSNLQNELFDEVIMYNHKIVDNNQKELNNLILIVIISTISTIFLSILIARRITNNIRKAQSIFHEISSGNLAMQWELSGSDELAELSRSVNALVIKLKTVISDVRNASDKVDTASSGLDNSSTVINKMSQTLTTNVSEAKGAAGELLNGFKHINDEAQSVSYSMKSIDESVLDFSNTIQNVASSTNRASQVVGEANEHVNTALKASEELSLCSKVIGSVLSDIMQVNEQTKILALNATIEATKAGEYGKGFEVVANEVRNLVGETNSATSKIKVRIKEITEAVGKVEKITNILVGSFSELSIAYNEIDTAITAQSSAANSIAENVGTTTKSLEQMVSSLSVAGEQINMIDNIVTSLDSAADSTYHEAMEGSKQSSDLKNIVQFLGDRVKTFKF